MNKRFCSITSTIALLALALLTAPGCALIGLEEEEEETTTVATGSLSDVEGTWVASCDSDLKTQTVQFSGTTLTYSTTQYVSNSCSSPRFSTSFVVSSLSAGSETTINGQKGYNFTGKTQSNTLTPADSSSASALNTMQYCGVTNWQANVAVSLAGKDCGNGIQSANGSDYADKYRVSGTSLTLNNISGTFIKQ